MYIHQTPVAFNVYSLTSCFNFVFQVNLVQLAGLDFSIISNLFMFSVTVDGTTESSLASFRLPRCFSLSHLDTVNVIFMLNVSVPSKFDLPKRLVPVPTILQALHCLPLFQHQTTHIHLSVLSVLILLLLSPPCVSLSFA